MVDVTADYLALRRDAGAVRLQRDGVAVEGPDARSFLHGQLSQDVHGLGPGSASWSWLLQPTGKVDALVRVVCLTPESFILDVDGGWGDRVATRLNRFKLRVKADVAPVEDWACIAVRGPAARPDSGSGRIVHDNQWPGSPGFDFLGGAGEVAHGVRECGLDAWEAVRVEAGVPSMGSELDDGVIPAEAGQWLMDRTVSFTKGCYTGQELVARIDSRGGNVPRRLRGVVVATNVLPPPGARVVAGGRDVGRLTSVAESLDRRAPVALAYVARAVDPPAAVTVAWDGGEVEARVETLPLVE